jgi:hypothetical protein
MTPSNFESSIICNAARRVMDKVPDLTFVNGTIRKLTRVNVPQYAGAKAQANA